SRQSLPSVSSKIGTESPLGVWPVGSTAFASAKTSRWDRFQGRFYRQHQRTEPRVAALQVLAVTAQVGSSTHRIMFGNLG
ncbi:MAG: hypothetical protein NTX09_15530, partial [Verrucomicrobia bacterium]|nr:hypothetical protein [Verrucomicrobiota bacterium]